MTNSNPTASPVAATARLTDEQFARIIANCIRTEVANFGLTFDEQEQIIADARWHRAEFNVTLALLRTDRAELDVARAEAERLREAASDLDACLGALQLWFAAGLGSVTFPKSGKAILTDLFEAAYKLRAALAPEAKEGTK